MMRRHHLSYCVVSFRTSCEHGGFKHAANHILILNEHGYIMPYDAISCHIHLQINDVSMCHRFLMTSERWTCGAWDVSFTTWWQGLLLSPRRRRLGQISQNFDFQLFNQFFLPWIYTININVVDFAWIQKPGSHTQPSFRRMSWLVDIHPSLEHRPS